MPDHYGETINEVAVGTAVDSSDEIGYESFASGMVFIKTAGMTTLTWHASATRGGTYMAAEDASSAAVSQTVANNQAHPIPVALLGARFLKITGNVAGTVAISLKD